MEKSNFLHEFIAGNVGGLIGITVVYPLDTAKVRIQVMGSQSNYGSTFNVLRSMSEKNGFFSLYRGLASPAMGFGITFAISFSSYGESCRFISAYQRKDVKELSYSEMTLAGAFTGLVQSPARQIMERVKTVMQIHEMDNGKSPYKWSGSCAMQLARTQGWKNGLFQGFSSVLLREIPQFAVYYPAYEYFKNLFSSHLNSPITVQLLAGGTAGVIQWLPPIYCFDVVKSRMQSCKPGTYDNLYHCAMTMYQKEGYQVFFRGLTPAIFRAFPLHAIIFVSYETVISYLSKP